MTIGTSSMTRVPFLMAALIALSISAGCSDDAEPTADSVQPSETAPVADSGVDVVSVCNLDGVRDPGEECDGTQFGEKTCADYGATGGELVCAACEIVTTHCTGSVNCTPDELEPNDTAITATAISALPYNKSGLTFCGNEDDWFLFTLEAGKSYRITVTFDSAEGDLGIYLFYPEDLNTPVSSSDGETSFEEIHHIVSDGFEGQFVLYVGALVPDPMRSMSYSIEIVETT